jgi:general secretion pathway protein A
VNSPTLSRHLERIGLGAHPFPVTPDASRYYLSARMEVNLTELLHCIDARRGFILVTADIGLGKTTLTRRLISLLKEQRNHVSLIFNSFLHGVDFLEAINRDFGVVVSGGIGEQLNALNDFLLSQFNQNCNAIIILDDAQNLSIENLELLRQISNLETDEHKLVQILLVAQTEIINTLSYPKIRQLKSRIALHIELLPYTPNESCSYIEFRLQSVGNSQNIHLSKSAYRYIQSESHGYPRQINLIMDRILYGVTAQKTNRIDGSLAKQAINDINSHHNKNNKTNRFSLFGIASVSIILLLIGWNLPSYNPSIFSNNVGAFKAASTTGIEPLTVSISAEEGFQKLNVMETEVDSRIQSFLEFAALTNIKGDLIDAIELRYFDQLNQKLIMQGWSLVLFSQALDDELNTLKIMDRDGKEGWLLLWPLPYEILDFNFGTESEGVKQLQRELSALGLYQSKVDGVVGGLTIRAVAQFQQRVGLPPSGQLTTKTRYLLQNNIL